MSWPFRGRRKDEEVLERLAAEYPDALFTVLVEALARLPSNRPDHPMLDPYIPALRIGLEVAGDLVKRSPMFARLWSDAGRPEAARLIEVWAGVAAFDILDALSGEDLGTLVSTISGTLSELLGTETASASRELGEFAEQDDWEQVEGSEMSGTRLVGAALLMWRSSKAMGLPVPSLGYFRVPAPSLRDLLDRDLKNGVAAPSDEETSLAITNTKELLFCTDSRRYILKNALPLYERVRREL